jgi:rhodanese-related sulfurtransferase
MNTQLIKRYFGFLSFIVLFLNAGFLQAQDTTGKAISEVEFAKRMQKRKTMVLDVRTPEEFKEGHIKNAINYNVLDSMSFDKQISQLKKNKKYLIYCKSGKRSGKALIMMQQKGFKNLYHLSGGITAWTQEIEKPVVQ